MEKPHVLRAYRIKKGLSAREMASMFGVAESTLRSYENGARTIPAEMALEIERKTGGEIRRKALLPELFGKLSAASA